LTSTQALVWVLIALPYYFALVIAVTTLEDTMNFIKQAAKALTALVVTAVTTFAAANGFDLTDAQVAALTAFLSAIAVYLVPNKTPEV
jgi:Na+/proline symporter